MSRLRKILVASVVGLGLGVGGTMASAAAPDEVSVETSRVPVAHAQADVQSPSAPPATAAVCEFPVNSTNGALQTKVITSSTPRFYPSTAWTNLECGNLTVTVPLGRSAGLVVRTDAELTCTGVAPDTFEWCLGRVLVNGIEAFPRALESDGSFAWAHSSLDAGAWESNSFTRSLPLRCAVSTTSVCSYRVQVQVRTHAPNLSFRVDDSTVEAQLTYS